MFDKKKWLDTHCVPLLGTGEDKLSIYSALWNGDPPSEVLVFLLAPEAHASSWGLHVKRLLDDGWRFDFLREQALVKSDTGLIPIFGGDGAPLFGKDGMASVRLFRRIVDERDEVTGSRSGVSLILQVGAKFPSGIDAAAAVKGFFALFDQNALAVCQSFAAPFGAA